MMPWLEAFHRPTTLPEALHLIGKAGKHGKFVAGATDLQVQADRAIRVLVDTTALKLAYVRRRRGRCLIGAATTLDEIEQSKELRRLADGILSHAAAATASLQIRNMATLGGKLASASPASDLAVALLVLDAQVVMASVAGRRQIPLSAFFRGPRQTVLNGELLTEIIIPRLPRGPLGWSFQRIARTEGDASTINVAAGIALDREGIIRWARIALGGVAPTPLRMTSAEALLDTRVLEEPFLGFACERVAKAIQPISDVRASAGYRAEMACVLVRRALQQCAARIGAKL